MASAGRLALVFDDGYTTDDSEVRPVLDDLDASVLLAERPRPRSLRERLLGRP